MGERRPWNPESLLELPKWQCPVLARTIPVCTCAPGKTMYSAPVRSREHPFRSLGVKPGAFFCNLPASCYWARGLGHLFTDCANLLSLGGSGRRRSPSERQGAFKQALALISSEDLMLFWGKGGCSFHVLGKDCVALWFYSEPRLFELGPPWHLWYFALNVKAARLCPGKGWGCGCVLMGLWCLGRF